MIVGTVQSALLLPSRRRLTPMKLYQIAGSVVLVLLVAAFGRQAAASFGAQGNQAKVKNADIPAFEYDPSWPKPLPNNWITGNIGGMYIHSKDHISVVHCPCPASGD